MKTRIKAFSIIELLVVIIVITIMLSIATPAWQKVTAKNRALAYTNELFTALHLARSEAIRLGKSVTFCGSTDHKTCDGFWQNGAIVVTASGEIKRVLPSIAAGDKLSWHGSFDVKDAIIFLPAGFPRGGQQGSFYYCPRNSYKQALAIILNSAGRVRISSKTAEDKRIPCNF